MGLLSMGSEEREALIRFFALQAATATKSPQSGMSTKEALERAKRFLPFLKGEEE